MAKVAAKTSTKGPKKTSSTASAKGSSSPDIEKACEEVLETLKTLGVDQQLQNDIEWCLGSYKADNNPVGLYAMADRALSILQQEKAKKTKGITAKMVTDLEKVIQARETEA
jgi:hypothetical protein